MTDDPHDEHPGLRWKMSGRPVQLSQLIGQDACTCWVGHCAEHRPEQEREIG